MTNKIRCPYCREIIDLDNPAGSGQAEPGIIRDEEAAAVETFNHITVADLNGDPYHDWPLIAARFQYSLPDLVDLIYSDPATARYVKEQKADSRPAGPSQLRQDLDAIRPYLREIVRNGQFVYGHQSRIAEALDVPNQGSYRRRIKNVVSALERTVIKTSTQISTSSTGSTAASQDQAAPNTRAA